METRAVLLLLLGTAGVALAQMPANPALVPGAVAPAAAPTVPGPTEPTPVLVPTQPLTVPGSAAAVVPTAAEATSVPVTPPPTAAGAGAPGALNDAAVVASLETVTQEPFAVLLTNPTPDDAAVTGPTAAAGGQVAAPTTPTTPTTTPTADPVVTPGGEPQPSTPPSTAPVRRRRRAGGVTAAAVVPGVASATCKLDAAGNVADVFLTRTDNTIAWGCTGNAAVLTGGRNVVVDVSDSPVVQVQQGKLITSPTGPVSWLAFKTNSSDLRTCGFNVQPSSANAVLSLWTITTASSLSSVSLTCAGTVLQTVASATFAASIPPFASLGYGLPASCTPVFTAPALNVSTAANTGCRGWIIAYGGAATPNASNPCPYASPPAQWAQPITRQQLPDVRPPNWVYRSVNTAISKSVTINTVPPLSCLFCSAKYITATVTHAPIPNVTAAMVNWWFNGNVDGDMVHPLNGVTYPRYLVWHPRDHVSQDTLIPGTTKGSATGAYWSIVEFMLANNRTGYTKASASWLNNYMAYNSIKVYSLTATTLDMRVEVDGANPFKLLHTWSDTTAGGWPALQLTSTMTLGVTSGVVAGSMNPVAWKLFGGDCAYAAATVWVQHCVEEMGNFQYFLPQLYRSKTGL